MAARGGAERRADSEVSPERVQGYPFRVPALIGEGTGGEFRIENLSLPENWQTADLVGLRRDAMRDRFVEYCGRRNLEAGNIEFDKTGRLLIQINMVSGARLELGSDFMGNPVGVYRMKGARDGREAIALVRFGILYVNYVCDTMPIHQIIRPYIDGGEVEKDRVLGYGSSRLMVPLNLYEAQTPVTNDYYQRQFVLEASNIAGRFGTELEPEGLQFNERGILRYVGVKGDRTCYYIEGSGAVERREYVEHNVDRPEQVLALHGIVAKHLNDLLEREELSRLARG